MEAGSLPRLAGKEPDVLGKAECPAASARRVGGFKVRSYLCAHTWAFPKNSIRCVTPVLGEKYAYDSILNSTETMPPPSAARPPHRVMPMAAVSVSEPHC